MQELTKQKESCMLSAFYRLKAAFDFVHCTDLTNTAQNENEQKRH